MTRFAFALKGSLLLTVLVAAVYILLSRVLISLFNQNPVIIDYGSKLLISRWPCSRALVCAT